MYTRANTHVSTRRSRGEYNRRRDQLEPAARKDALVAEPPQDARCTFCVNIWNDFEIMIAIFGPGDARGIFEGVGLPRCRRERAAEAKEEVKEKEKVGGEGRNEEEKRK